MNETTEDTAGLAWSYTNGQWTQETTQPIEWHEGQTWRDCARTAGYEPFMSQPNRDGEVPGIELFVRTHPEAWVLVIEGEFADVQISTDRFPDAMTLLAQFMPILRELSRDRLTLLGALLDLAADKGYGPELDAVVRRIAKAAR